MHFKLGGRDNFLTKEEFNNLFDFKHEGLESSNTFWSPHSFWVNNVKLNVEAFLAGHSKSSSLFSKILWYMHRLIIYSFHVRGLSNEAVSFDDIFLLHCI